MKMAAMGLTVFLISDATLGKKRWMRRPRARGMTSGSRDRKIPAKGTWTESFCRITLPSVSSHSGIIPARESVYTSYESLKLANQNIAATAASYLEENIYIYVI